METKRENFKRISKNRLSKILLLMNQLVHLSNGSFYEYTEEEINALFDEIDLASKKARLALLEANEKKRKNKNYIL